MNYQYAITAKKTRKPISQTHYLDYLDYITDLGKVGNVNFETTKGLHTHFILKCEEKLDYRKLKPTQYGWNVKAVPIYNRKGWIKYCRKDNLKNTHLQELVPTKYINKREEEEEYIIPPYSLFK